MRIYNNPIEDYIIVLECEEITIYFVEEILELVSKINIIHYNYLSYFTLFLSIMYKKLTYYFCV